MNICLTQILWYGLGSLWEQCLILRGANNCIYPFQSLFLCQEKFCPLVSLLFFFCSCVTGCLASLCQVADREQHKVTIFILRGREVIILMGVGNILSSLDPPTCPLQRAIFMMVKKALVGGLCNLSNHVFMCVHYGGGVPATLPVDLTCYGHSPALAFTGEITLGMFVSKIGACLENVTIAPFRRV